MDAAGIAEVIRGYRGFVRKAPLGNAMDRLAVPAHLRGEDAAIIDLGGSELLLLAVDGIWDPLVHQDPRFAGFCAVVVNVNDIVAMGGTPRALVNVVSANTDSLPAILAGIREGAELVGVPVVGGHVHPDSPRDAVSATVLGSVQKNSLLTSSGARPGDAIVVAVDLAGECHPQCPVAWCSFSARDSAQVRTAYDAVRTVAVRGMASACKDISNPGVVGTLGMLCETSGVGALVHLDSLPRPEGVPLETWVRTYPGQGFVFTTDRPDACIEVLSAHFSVAVVGDCDASNTLRIELAGEEAAVADLQKDGVMGLRSHSGD